MPKILADQDSDAAETRGVERHEPIAGREVSLLVEQPVSRQIHLAMDVDHPAALGPKRGVVEAVMRRLFDEAHDQRHRPGGVDQLPNLRPGGRNRQIGHHVADEIAGQRQFGKDDQVGVLPPGGLDLLEVQGEVARKIAQHRRNLSHRHPQRAGAHRSQPMLRQESADIYFSSPNATRIPCTKSSPRRAGILNVEPENLALGVEQKYPRHLACLCRACRGTGLWNPSGREWQRRHCSRHRLPCVRVRTSLCADLQSQSPARPCCQTAWQRRLSKTSQHVGRLKLRPARRPPSRSKRPSASCRTDWQAMRSCRHDPAVRPSAGCRRPSPDNRREAHRSDSPWESWPAGRFFVLRLWLPQVRPATAGARRFLRSLRPPRRRRLRRHVSSDGFGGQPAHDRAKPAAITATHDLRTWNIRCPPCRCQILHVVTDSREPTAAESIGKRIPRAVGPRLLRCSPSDVQERDTSVLR